jgi:O-antigen ligase
MFVLVANCIRNREALDKISLSIIFIGLLSAVWAFYQISSGVGNVLFNINALEGYYRHERLLSHYGIGLMGEISPLTVATFFSFMSFWAFSFFLSYSDRPIKKIYFLFAGLLFTVCSIYTGEKISLLYFFLCFAVLSFLDFRKMAPFIIGVISLIILIVLIKTFFIGGTSFNSVERVFHWQSYIGGFVSRIDGWRSVIDTGFPFFLTGVGKGGLHHIFEEAHNNYIKLLFESGIFGLVSFVWLLGSIGLLCIRAYRHGADVIDKVIGGATLCCLVSICAAAIVQDAFKPVLVNSIFWVFVGITAAVDGIRRGEL